MKYLAMIAWITSLAVGYEMDVDADRLRGAPFPGVEVGIGIDADPLGATPRSGIETGIGLVVDP